MNVFISNESLKNIRMKLKRCLAAKHIQTDTSIKKVLLEAVEILNSEIEKKDSQLDVYKIFRLVGKILDKLPGIMTLFEKLK